jgi:beta-exotoxin I transport system ATP-binding protein
MALLLETKGLTKDYGSRRALADLTIAMAPGEIVGLLGPNGSGKTTALRLILGFLRPTKGQVFVSGHDCWRDGPAARRAIAYLPGELRLYENLTGRQLLRFLSKLRGDTAADPAPLSRRFDLDLDRPISQLSSGMKRKVALRQALLPEAPLLILDEPTNTLDPDMRENLLRLLGEARERGQSVLFSSHVLSEVEQLATRVALLRRGELVHCGSLAELQRGTRLKIRFQGEAPSPPALPGITVESRIGDLLIFELEGEWTPLLRWLGSQSVKSIDQEPLGLTQIYHRYHGAQP